jgi:hypothetical protein
MLEAKNKKSNMYKPLENKYSAILSEAGFNLPFHFKFIDHDLNFQWFLTTILCRIESHYGTDSREFIEIKNKVELLIACRDIENMAFPESLKDPFRYKERALFYLLGKTMVLEPRGSEYTFQVDGDWLDDHQFEELEFSDSQPEKRTYSTVMRQPLLTKP